MAVARYDALRSAAFGSITGSYTTLGTPIQHLFRAFCLTNNTDGDLFISFDGTTDNIFIPKNGFRLYDVSTNSPPISAIDNLVIGINTQFYVKYSTAPTSGSVWLEGLYAKGE